MARSRPRSNLGREYRACARRRSGARPRRSRHSRVELKPLEQMDLIAAQMIRTMLVQRRAEVLREPLDETHGTPCHAAEWLRPSSLSSITLQRRVTVGVTSCDPHTIPATKLRVSQYGGACGFVLTGSHSLTLFSPSKAKTCRRSALSTIQRIPRFN